MIRNYSTIKGPKSVPHEVVKLLNLSIIPEATTVKPGHAQKTIQAQFIASEELAKVPTDIIADYLDDFNFNFGYGASSRQLRDDILYVTCVVYID